jgi:hypothetical protein
MNNFIGPMLAVLLCCSACAPWSLVGGKYVAAQENYEVELPLNWRKQNLSGDHLYLTRDGMVLQRVIIGRYPIDKDAPRTKRKLSKAMLPQDLAEIVIDDLRSDQQKTNVQILENLPVNVGGNAGFTIVYSYQTRSTLKKMGAYYGALHKDWLYFLMYEAPARHYFSRDRSTFDSIKESFKLLN